MIHPDTELRFVNNRIGHGVFATRDIPQGTITWARDDLDQAFSRAQLDRLAEPYQTVLRKYAYTDRDGSVVLCWDHARFMNHSCEPSCLGSAYGFEIAVREIRAGEELTDDYGGLNLVQRFACACGSPRCRRELGPGDGVALGAQWDTALRGSFARIQAVAQPLWWLVREPDEVRRASADVTLMRSCQENVRRREHAEVGDHRGAEASACHARASS